MNNSKKAVLVAHFPEDVMRFIDKMRGKKSRQAFITSYFKDMRLDYELEIILSQDTAAN